MKVLYAFEQLIINTETFTIDPKEDYNISMEEEIDESQEDNQESNIRD
jgi:hypothetical protein